MLDIKIDIHTHTVASTHGMSTIDEYVRYAKKYGFQMIGISDHGPEIIDAPKLMHFYVLPSIPRIVDDIAILRGIEANIRPNGSIDVTPRIRKSVDYILAGFHNDVYKSSDYDIVHNTDTLIKVIEECNVDVISHPGNKNYPIDYRAVCLAAKEYNVALEINGSTSVFSRIGSHDNCVAIAKIIAEVGCNIIIGSDAHICYNLGKFDECYRVLNEANKDFVYEDLIINTNIDKLLSFLERRGHKRITEFDKLR
ncbi:MAG: PHP domain-containing protein [Succinivibrionaceae bacterium]